MVRGRQLTLFPAYFDGITSIFGVGNIGVYGGRRVVEWAVSSGEGH